MTAEPSGPLPAAPTARTLCDVRELAANAAQTANAAQAAGVRWKLAEPARQLDANVVHLPPGRQVDTHTEPDLDVLFLVVAGQGSLGAHEHTERLAEGTMCWLPRGSTRSLRAGPDGMSYLTVHTRRPGMTIKGPPPASAQGLF